LTDSYDAEVVAEDRRRWMALYVLCLGMLMIVLDATIVNVALPSIQEDLGFSQSDLAWVVNAYLIAFGGLLLLAGRIGDLIGQRRIFLIGLAVFTGASLLCARAQGQGLLIGARFVQGVGGALTSAVILGMIVTMFPEPREQASAIGIYTFVAVAGGSIGLLAGGVLTQAITGTGSSSSTCRWGLRRRCLRSGWCPIGRGSASPPVPTSLAPRCSPAV
jgi:MFS family permease